MGLIPTDGLGRRSGLFNRPFRQQKSRQKNRQRSNDSDHTLVKGTAERGHLVGYVAGKRHPDNDQQANQCSDQRFMAPGCARDNAQQKKAKHATGKNTR